MPASVEADLRIVKSTPISVHQSPIADFSLAEGKISFAIRYSCIKFMDDQGRQIATLSLSLSLLGSLLCVHTHHDKVLIYMPKDNTAYTTRQKDKDFPRCLFEAANRVNFCHTGNSH